LRPAGRRPIGRNGAGSHWVGVAVSGSRERAMPQKKSQGTDGQDPGQLLREESNQERREE
jgi:hypothetical protein